ncbi:MAG: phosphoribosyltransferase family protein, partial [bacterium]
IRKEEKVVVVEDVVTTGGSVKEIVEIVQDEGGKVEGIGVIVDRSKPSLSDEMATLNLPLNSLLRIDIETYSPEECPICKKGIPLQKPGSK